MRSKLSEISRFKQNEVCVRPKSGIGDTFPRQVRKGVYSVGYKWCAVISSVLKRICQFKQLETLNGRFPVKGILPKAVSVGSASF
jgi:hypothetical protein